MAGLHVLPQEEIDIIVEVMDYYFKHPNRTVGHIKEKFNLTEEEYQMIFFFCMPMIRYRNNERYWIGKTKSTITTFENLVGYAENNGETSIDVKVLRAALNKCSISDGNNKYKEIYNEYQENTNPEDLYEVALEAIRKYNAKEND